MWWQGHEAHDATVRKQREMNVAARHAIFVFSSLFIQSKNPAHKIVLAAHIQDTSLLSKTFLETPL